MKINSIYHVVDSPYVFPSSKNEMVIRLRTAKDDIKSVVLCFESKYTIGESQNEIPMEKKYRGKLYDYYEVTLTLRDTRLAYVFKVTGKDGFTGYFSEDGITKNYDFKKGYYNFFQYPYINGADILPAVKWMDNASFYQIFVDRFNTGIKEKDRGYIDLEWGDIPSPKSFAGGDIKGITNKLDYIRNETGCNAVYLTPVFESPSNHKYDIVDYYNVAKHFGTNEDLRELVSEAHRRGMKIVLDAVFNHTSDRIDMFADVCKKGRNSKFHDWYIIYGDKPVKDPCNYETFASCTYMPKLNTSCPECAEYLLDVAVHYIKEYDIDGWRLDVSDEISHDFWRVFRKRVKSVKPDAVILGENWHDANTYLKGDQYDGIMNYAFTKLCLDYFAWNKKNEKETADTLNDILMRNSKTVNRMMLNLIDSHDTKRFLTETGENVFKLKSALMLMYMFPGAPCIFYGTESLITGGFDPDCRRCMPWDSQNDPAKKDMREFLYRLSELRRQFDLYKGDLQITALRGTLMMTYQFEEHGIVLRINKKKSVIRVDGKVYLIAEEDACKSRFYEEIQ